MTTLSFIQYNLTGTDSEKFLQGQITCNVKKITDNYQATAICNLKGRIIFGIWLKKIENGYQIVLSADLANDFSAHVKKYGAFSKITLSEAREIFPTVIDNLPTFDEQSSDNGQNWQQLSIATGNYWLTKETQELFQPQELRLHQRGGVDYDKGCYLGQEIIARLWFKASPKAWVHRIRFAKGFELTDKMQIVNQISLDNDIEALVVARPDDVVASGVTVLPLPNKLQQPIGRETA